MTLRDLSYWGIFRLILIAELLVPVLLSPLFLYTALTDPSKFTIDWDTGVEFLGSTFRFDPGSKTILSYTIYAILLSVIALLIKSALLNLVFQKTSVGKISIGFDRSN